MIYTFLYKLSSNFKFLLLIFVLLGIAGSCNRILLCLLKFSIYVFIIGDLYRRNITILPENLNGVFGTNNVNAELHIDR